MLKKAKRTARKTKNVSPLLKNGKFIEYESGTSPNTGENLNTPVTSMTFKLERKMLKDTLPEMLFPSYSKRTNGV